MFEINPRKHWISIGNWKPKSGLRHTSPANDWNEIQVFYYVLGWNTPKHWDIYNNK